MTAPFDPPAGLIDQVCTWIEEEDASLKEMAVKIGCATSTLQTWLTVDAVRSARVRAARQLAAETCMRKELEVIDQCNDSALPAAVAKMRERVAHWRRRAAIRNPAYSERFVLETKPYIDPDRMSDADLLAIAVQSGVSGPVIEGFAEVVQQRRLPQDGGAE